MSAGSCRSGRAAVNGSAAGRAENELAVRCGKRAGTIEARPLPNYRVQRVHARAQVRRTPNRDHLPGRG